MPKPVKESPHAHFVSVISGILIVVSVAAILMSVLQHELISSRVSTQDIADFLNTRRGRQLPGIVRFYHNNLQLMARLALLVSAVTLFCAIGLLKRKEWARISSIILFILGICWCIGGVVFYESMMPPSLKATASLYQTASVLILHAFRVISFAVSSAFIILFIWLIRKFSLREIRQEFKK